MVSKVEGFLAEDGTFFEREPECKRHESLRKIEYLCESHGINFDNFIATLNAWHGPIREYYNANDDCEQGQVTGGEPSFEEPLSPLKEDRTNPAIGDKDTKGFLANLQRQEE